MKFSRLKNNIIPCSFCFPYQMRHYFQQDIPTNDISQKRNDMWERERKNDPDTTKVRDVYELNDVEIRDGDVAIITLDTKLSDQYTTGILYLN